MTLSIDVIAPGVGIDWILKYVLELERLPFAESVTLESAEPGRATLRVETDAQQRFLAEVFNVQRYPADRMRMLSEDQFEVVVNPGTLRIVDNPVREKSHSGGAIEDMSTAAPGRPGTADRILASAATSMRLRSAVDTEADDPDDAAEWTRNEAYQRARAIVNEAYETAAEIRLEALSRSREQMAGADLQSAHIAVRATEESQRITAQATAEAQIALQRAQRDADTILSQARLDAVRYSRSAHEAADEVTESARREAQEVLNSVSAALRQVTERQAEIERLESEFHAVATQFMKWLGTSGRPQEKVFRNLLAKVKPTKPGDRS